MLTTCTAVKSPSINQEGSLKAWLVCLSAGLFFLYEFFQLNIFDTINSELQNAFHADAVQLGWMSSSYLLADIIFLLPAGILLDRFSPRKVILTALSICVIGTLGFALTNSYSLAFFFHFLSGIGNAFCFLSCVMLISRWFPPQRQAFLVGIVVTMAFIGGMLAHTPFAKLNALYGWRQALLIDAALGSIILLWIYTFVEDRPQGSAQEISQDNNSSMQGFVHALKNSQNWLAGLYTSFLNLPIMVFGALWGSNYLMSVFGVEKMAASTITANILLGSIIGCPLSGWLSDKSGKRKPIMIVGALSSLVLMIPLYQGISMSAFHLHLLFFFVGVSTSTQVVSYPLIAESNPSKYTGVATGLASVLIMGGAGVAQMIFSSVLQISASQHRIISSVSETSLHYSAVDYQKAALMFPIAFFLALLAVLRLKETNCKPQN